MNKVDFKPLLPRDSVSRKTLKQRAIRKEKTSNGLCSRITCQNNKGDKTLECEYHRMRNNNLRKKTKKKWRINDKNI